MITRIIRDHACKASTSVHSWPRGERNMYNWIYYKECVVCTTIKGKLKYFKSPNEEKFNSYMGLGEGMISREEWFWS